jgi:hypothetical protein
LSDCVDATQIAAKIGLRANAKKYIICAISSNSKYVAIGGTLLEDETGGVTEWYRVLEEWKKF